MNEEVAVVVEVVVVKNTRICSISKTRRSCSKLDNHVVVALKVV
jgi:hypothetical protein